MLEFCLYPEILLLDHFPPCFSDPPPVLPVDSIPVNLCAVNSNSVQQSAGEEEPHISFILVWFKIFILFYFADFLKPPMGVQESVALYQNKTQNPLCPPPSKEGL